MSPLPRASLQAGNDGLSKKSRPWHITAPDFFSTCEAVRTEAGRLLGSTANHIALVPSASYGIAVAAKNMRAQKGQTIIVLAEQYPSNIYAWRRLAADTGATIRTIARPEDGNWTPGILNEINQRTAFAALPQCHWTDGSVIELSTVRDALDAVGAGLVLDLTQSLGAMHLDLSGVRPDFAVAAAYKWLLGPYSTGLLYVDPRHHEGTPLEEHAYPRKNAVDFRNLVDYREDFEPGARRFDVGEMANFGLLPALLSSLRQINAWGAEQIAKSLSCLTDQIAELAQDAGYALARKENRAPHFIGLRSRSGLPDDLASRLAERGVFVSLRGDALRVTPHLYNNNADIRKLFVELSRLSL